MYKNDDKYKTELKNNINICDYLKNNEFHNTMNKAYEMSN